MNEQKGVSYSNSGYLDPEKVKTLFIVGKEDEEKCLVTDREDYIYTYAMNFRDREKHNPYSGITIKRVIVVGEYRVKSVLTEGIEEIEP